MEPRCTKLREPSDARDADLQRLSRYVFEVTGVLRESFSEQQFLERRAQLVEWVRVPVPDVLAKSVPAYHAFKRIVEHNDLGAYVTDITDALTSESEVFVYAGVNDTLGLFAEEDAARRKAFRERQKRRIAARKKEEKAAMAALTKKKRKR